MRGPTRGPMRGSRATMGCTRSVPTRPTGTTVAPASRASFATPGRPRYSRPSGDLVPSGKMPSTFPCRSTGSAASSASRLARPPDRSTGIWFSPDITARMGCDRKYSSLAR